MKRYRSRSKRIGFITVLFLLFAFALLSAPTIYGQEAPVSTPEVTPEATAEATPEATPETTPEVTPEVTPDTTPELTPEATPEVTPESTPEITPEVTPETTPEATAEVTPDTTPEVTPEVTPEATPEVTPEVTPDIPVDTTAASCAMQIGDAGDTDPLTYALTAVATNIDQYEWFVDGVSVAMTQNHTHTFPGTGTYGILLRCTSLVFGVLNVTGSVSIASLPQANFAVTPSTTGFAPFTVYTSNTSTGENLSFSWEIFDITNGGASIATGSTATISYTFNTVGTYRIRLIASNASGSSVMEQDVIVTERPPQADFSLTPSTGTAPLTVTVNGIIRSGSGPVSNWSWSFPGGSITSASTQGPHTITYATAGTYTITLNYSNSGGSGTVTKTLNVVEDGVALNASFVLQSQTNDGTGVRLCFRNTSTGPVARSIWNFGDGSPLVTDNAEVVCYTYASGGTYTVRLRIENLAGTATSNAQRAFTVVAAPVAIFSATSPVVWHSSITFDGATSTGLIDTYAWAINGTTVSGAAGSSLSIANIGSGTVGSMMRLGANIIRLTVTGPGGTSFVEQIVIVDRLELTCDFTGSLALTPTSGAQTYTSAVGNIAGRTVTYDWQVLGTSLNQRFNTQNLNFTFPAGVEDTYTVILRASTPDGANCSTTKTVTVTWPALTCSLSGPTNLTPNGTARTYSVTVGNVAGRTLTYRWFVDGTELVGETGTSINRTYGTNTTETITVEVTPSTGAPCTANRNVNASYPALTCSINGNAAPRPNMPSDPGGVNNYTYSANVGDASGRTLTYQWLVNGNPVGTSNSITRNWNHTAIGSTDVITLVVTAAHFDGLTSTCNTAALNATVTMPALTCNLPNGDDTPVVGESVTFTRNVSNEFGRTPTSLTWDFEQETSPGVWTPIATGQASANYARIFSTPSERFRVRYAVAHANPTQNCTSGWKTINVAGVGQDFTCDGWDMGFGDFTPESSSANYTYRVNIDNTNALSLRYRWYLRDPNGVERLLGTQLSTNDNSVTSIVFNGAALGPVGNYTLRVDVDSDPAVIPAPTMHACSMQAALTVGTFAVDFTRTLTASDIEVGAQICLDNTSSTSHNGIDGMTYVWDFTDNRNSTGQQTSTAQEPGCLSFSRQGTYTITLTGTTTFGQTATRTVTYRVWDAQSILLNRADANMFAGSTFGFNASGVNINSYSWNIYRVSTGARVGAANRSSTSISQVLAVAGQYRVVVVGTGPLGNTTAELMVNVIGLDDISAAFTPSQYVGIAAMRVCFTDNSTSGVQLTNWEWDFGNGQTLTYDNNNIPAQICTDYTQAGQSFPVTLRVTNVNSTQQTASNIVRTYTAFESNASFSVNPTSATRYCFTAQIPAGVNVTEWLFGDGGTVTGSGTSCHTFQSAGVYLVTMRISDGATTGEIVRPIVVGGPTGGAAILELQAECTLNQTATFTVRNTGGAMANPDQVTIRNEAGTAIFIGSVQLGAGETFTRTFSNQLGVLTMRLTDLATQVSTTCYLQPALTLDAACTVAQTATFTIQNTGGAMRTADTVVIRMDGGATLYTGSLQLGAGETFTRSFDNQLGVLIMEVTNAALSTSTTCYQQPALTLQATCSADRTATFTIRNTGGAMRTADTVTIGMAGVPALYTGALQLGAGETFTRTFSNQLGELTMRVTNAALSISTTCAEPGLSAASTTATPAPTPAPLTVASVDGVGQPSWGNTCGRGCPDFVMYHTNETGDWEIFRVDSADDRNRTSQRENLSLGVGVGVNDMAPSLSPNTEWIVFSSNRATEPGQPENWELFVAPTSGGNPDAVQRVTYNTTAIDTDPVWGPNNWVVFETNRNGNWDLYAVDMTTGREYQLTDDEADDVNPSWSPDGSKLVFQSARTGVWQIFEMELAMLRVRQISDDSAIDVEPIYSNDGTRIAFRSYMESDSRSQIGIMTADGTSRRLITTPEEDATNHSWSPTDSLIAYQSDLDGDLDIYVYQVSSGDTRQITDNTIDDYAPTWRCAGDIVIFTSDIEGDPNIFEEQATPITAPPVLVEESSDQLTFEPADDIYPQMNPSEENASREGQTSLGEFGEQTTFLMPNVMIDTLDLSIDGIIREDWLEIDGCP